MRRPTQSCLLGLAYGEAVTSQLVQHFLGAGERPHQKRWVEAQQGYGRLMHPDVQIPEIARHVAKSRSSQMPGPLQALSTTHRSPADIRREP
jgi:hypothetical protein